MIIFQRATRVVYEVAWQTLFFEDFCKSSEIALQCRSTRE